MKFKHLLLALCLAFTITLSAQTFTNAGLTYKVIDESEKTCQLSDGSNCGSSVIIPSEVNGYTVTEIGIGAFFRKTNIETLELPATLKKINTTAFIGCTGLQSVYIPKSVNTIGIAAFGECTALTELTVDPDNKTFVSLDGLILNKSKSKVICAAPGLSSYNIPSSVSTIGGSAFFGCQNMTALKLPAGLGFIDNSAFNGCTSLSDINIPGGVCEIGSSAFANCSSLEYVDIPAATYLIDAGAFSHCTSLTEINVHPDNYTYTNVNGLVLNYSETTVIVCPAGLTKVEIPETVTRIGTSSFSGCANLENINIPATVTSIGSYAFTGCKALKVMVMHDGLEKIEPNTFFGCSSLSGVIIPSTVTEIGASAFEKCTSLRNIDIPAGGQTIKAFAFRDCSELQYIMLGEDIKTIEMKSFQNCKNIETVVCYNNEIPKLSGTAFDTDVYATAELRVNPDCIDSYKSANNWSNFRIGEIQDKLVTAIVLDNTERSAQPGESFMLSAEVYTQDAFNKTLKWTTDNPDVAVVDETGDVTMIGTGMCEIAAESVDGSSVRAVCRINAMTTGIEVISQNNYTDEKYADIYNLEGRLVVKQMEVAQVGNLPRGIYVLKYKDHAVKRLVQ